MFASQKRIFAGKGNLQARPFCPFVTSEAGYSSLLRTKNDHTTRLSPEYGGFFKTERMLRPWRA